MVRRVEGESPVDLLRHCAPQPLICCLPLGPPPSRFTATSTMDSSGMLRGLLLVGLLSILCHGQASREVSAEDFGEKKQEAAVDRDLVSICRAVSLWRKAERRQITKKRKYRFEYKLRILDGCCKLHVRYKLFVRHKYSNQHKHVGSK